MKKIGKERCDNMVLQDKINKLRNRINNLDQARSKQLAYCMIGVAGFMWILAAIVALKYTPLLSSFKLFLNENGIYTEPLKTITIKQNDSEYYGDWKLVKTVVWKEPSKAEITYNLTSKEKAPEGEKDVLFVIDTSSEMENNDKISSIKTETKRLISKLLIDEYDNATGNKVGLITFNSTATTRPGLGFTTNKIQLDEDISNITLGEGRNFKAAMDAIKDFLTSHANSSRDITVVFIVGGAATANAGEEVAVYNQIKTSYNNIVFNAFQFEAGNQIISGIGSISDNLYMTDRNTIRSILNESTINPVKYSYLKIRDEINENYFSIINNTQNASSGVVSITNETDNKLIEWRFDNKSLSTGASNTLTINIQLKEGLFERDDLFPVSKKITIRSKLDEDGEEEVLKEETITNVLKSKYKVKYELNLPGNCNINTSYQDEEYAIFSLVTKKTEQPICTGYLFKGWEIRTDDAVDVERPSTDTFKMPGHDVTLRATWAYFNIKKTLTGDIFSKTSLYDAVREESTKTYTRTYYDETAHENVTESYKAAKLYTGTTKDSYTKPPRKSVYYYSDAKDSGNKNNVIFAGLCWQIIRTTDTGGVKLMYNGMAADGMCENNGFYNPGYDDRTPITFDTSAYYYGSGYTFNNNTGKFSLTGDVFSAVWSSSTYQNLIGKYTCKQTTNDTCDTLYYLESKGSTLSIDAYAYKIDNHVDSIHTFGTIQFNPYDGLSENSIAYAGYMYNTVYNHKTISMAQTENMALDTNNEHRYTYGTSYTYSQATGKYTIHREYTVQIDDEHTETRDEPIKVDRYHASQLKGMYVCKDADANNSCTNVWFVVGNPPNYSDYTPTNANLRYVDSATPIKFGQGYSYYGSQFNLSSTIGMWEFNQASVQSSLNNHRYFCLSNLIGTSCNRMGFITLIDSPTNTETYGSTLKYLEVTEPSKNVQTMINEMLYNNDVNEKDSVMKIAIEEWYRNFLLDYDKYIEDTIYCNDRRLANSNAFSPTAASVTIDSIKFYEGEAHTSNSLECPTETDQFSTKNNKAKLKYPVGLMTKPEYDLQGGTSSSFMTGKQFWLMSPNRYSDLPYITMVPESADTPLNETIHNIGLRPVISLKAGVGITGGNGSKSSPYIVKTD